MTDSAVPPKRLLLRVSNALGLLCIATAAVVPMCFLSSQRNETAAAIRFGLTIIAPLAIAATGALTMASHRGANCSLRRALAWELAGIIGLALAWLVTLLVARRTPLELATFVGFSAPFVLVWLLKLGCWLCLIFSPDVALANPSVLTANRARLLRRLDAIVLLLSLAAAGAWAAEALFLLTQLRGDNADVARSIMLFDALPPGFLAGALLVAAAVARRRQRARDARLLGCAGLTCLAATLAYTDLIGRSTLSHNVLTLGADTIFQPVATASLIFLGARLVAGLLVGAIRTWIGDPAAAVSLAPSRDQSDRSRAVGRMPDLLSFLAVLLTWFCVVPVPDNYVYPLVIPGAGMFIAGFPVGIVGVGALLATGLLRAGPDRRRLLPLELFGVLALMLLFVAGALPIARNIMHVRPIWVGVLVHVSWLLFSLTIGAKLAWLAAGLIRRRERAQFSLLGILAFVAGCGALLMYWREWLP